MYSFDNVIGNTVSVELLKRDILTKASSRLLLFHGDVGTGKSSTALIYANAYCCESPVDSSPCGSCSTCKRNILSLSKKQNSARIQIVNMALHKSNNDLNSLISEIFTLQSVEKSVYILEELHLLSKDMQASLLKEIDFLNENMKIIITTSRLSSIDKGIQSRSSKFRFGPLSREESRLLCSRVPLSSKLSKEILDLIIESSGFIPRNMLVSLKFLLENGTDEEMIKEYLQYISEDSLIELIKSVYSGNISEMRVNLEELKSTLDVHNIVSNLMRFVTNCVYYLEGDTSLFNPSQRKIIKSSFETKGLLYLLAALEKVNVDQSLSIDRALLACMVKFSPKAVANEVVNVKSHAEVNDAKAVSSESFVGTAKSLEFTKL